MSRENCGTVRIICAGERGRLFEKKNGDFVIAADGGLDYAREAGIKPDLCVGDFDSVKCDPSSENVIRLPTEKDDTDTLYAVKKGLELGFDEFAIYCGSGGEIDHLIANIQILLMLAKSGKRGYLMVGKRVITAAKDERITFSKSCSGRFSVFAAEDSATVCISGAKYDFSGQIKNTFPIGVSNEFIGEEVQICAYKPVIAVFDGDIYDRGDFKRERGE